MTRVLHPRYRALYGLFPTSTQTCHRSTHTFGLRYVFLILIRMTITFYPITTAIATKETSVAVSREETEKRESRPGFIAKPSVGDRGRRWTGRW
jgi:hypothetical protein